MLADHVVARDPAEEQRVEGTQQSGLRERRGLFAFAQVDEAVAEVIYPARDRGKAGAGVAQRQAGPAGEVGVGGRAVADQVAAGELGEGGIAVGERMDPSLTNCGEVRSGSIRSPFEASARAEPVAH